MSKYQTPNLGNSFKASICLAGLICASAAVAQIAKVPFLKSADGKLAASFSGPRCGQEVAFTFTGPDQTTFNKGGVATRLMNNVVVLVRQSCPQVKMVSAKGVVGSQVVYNAIAEGETRWLLLELGSSRDAGMLTGTGRGTSADRANFARRKDFSGFGDVLATMKGKMFLCDSAMSGSCTASSEFRNATDKRANVTLRSLLDKGGTKALMTYSATNQNGFMCFNPEAAKIEVVGGQSSPAARVRFATDLRERLKPYGSQVCSGYALRGSQLVSANFGADGARIGNETILTALASEPALRQEK